VKWLHNLTHTHPALHAPDAAPVQGFIAICAGKWDGKVKSGAWIPEGYRWGYVIPDDMPITDVLDMLEDPEKYKEWTKTARRTNE
jgi:hypothetical protein